MTREQLQASRAERWHQNGEALLTFDAAQAWLRETGICLFLPRKMQLPVPAPSFVEACLGETNPTPSREAIEAATAMLVRLIDAGDVVALNLLGMAGEQPDFLVTLDFLPYIFALRGDRDWKHDPRTAGTGRVSPLVFEVWKAIERTGVQTAIEIRETLGKELTEAAVLRGLHELWTGMRIILLPGENGEPATWEALKTRHEKACAKGTATSQVTALSVLLARYLQSAVAATSEEAEIFLSPLASRSKVREVIRGLSATRQLETYSLDAQPLLYVEGTLPEFSEPLAPSDIEAIPASHGAAPQAEAGSRIRKYTPRPAASGPDPLRWKRDSSVPVPPGKRRSSTFDSPRDDAPRPVQPEGESFAARRAPAPRPGRPASGPRREGAEGEKKRWTPREGAADRPRREGSFSRPAGKLTPREGGAPRRSAGGERPAFGSRPPASRGFGARPSTPRGASSRPPSGRPSFGKGAEFPEKKRFSPAEGSSRPRTFGGAGAGRPRADRPTGDRPARPSYTKPWEERPDRPAGARPAAGKPSGARTGYPKAGGGKFGPRRPAGAAPGEGAGSAKKGRWVPRTGAGDRREERPKREGGFAGPSGRVSTRSGGAGKGRPTGDRPYTVRPAGDRPYTPRPSGSRSTGGRPSGGGSSRPYSKRFQSRTTDGKFAPRREGPGGPGARPSKPWSERPPRSEGSRPRPEGGFERKRPASGGAASGDRRPRTFGARPSSGKPSTGRPSSGRPAYGKTSSGRPSSGRPSSGRPSTGGSGFKARPGGAGKPGGFSKKRGPGDYPPRKKRPE